MEQTISAEKRIQEVLANDPLFEVIRETPTEQLFLSEPYLNEIIEKKYYSTPEIASWFDVTDAQLRYYIKPFEDYLFDSQGVSNPTTANLIRLDFKAILKLRMILLLKDEYRVKGLKQLLRINEDGHIIKQVPAAATEIATPNDVENKLQVMSHALAQIMQTGLFHIEQDEQTEEMTITLNEAFLHQKIKALPSESSQKIEKLQVQTEKLEQQNKKLTEKIEGILLSNKEDIAIKIREKHIERSVFNRLENEALTQYAATKGRQFFRKLFRSTQIEIEKKQYIAAYIEEHFPEQLKQELQQYHAQSVE